jgi:hypothetical protein
VVGDDGTQLPSGVPGGAAVQDMRAQRHPPVELETAYYAQHRRPAAG